MNNKYLNELITDAVSDYKTQNYKYLNEVKTLVFNYLLGGYTYEDFNKKLKKLNSKTFKELAKGKNKSFKEIKEEVTKTDSQTEGGTFKISEEELNDLKFKLDSKNEVKARDKFVRIIQNYYKDTYNTLQKEYIDENEYLNRKLTDYDKVEKVVPYHSKDTGEIVSYHDIADYNAMVYNINLTNTAWNATYDACKEFDQDIIYVEPHPWACEHCQRWQGKFYSISGKSLNYPPLDIAIDGGLKHPNCRHVITTYYGQEETDIYSSPEWVERYNAKQKYQALELKASRLENDMKIFQKLNNQEKVDKIEQQLKKLNEAMQEQEAIYKLSSDEYRRIESELQFTSNG